MGVEVEEVEGRSWLHPTSEGVLKVLSTRAAEEMEEAAGTTGTAGTTRVGGVAARTAARIATIEDRRVHQEPVQKL